MPAPPSRLKSRHPYNKAAQEMLNFTSEDISRDAWLAAAWKQEWESAGPSESTATFGTQEMAPLEERPTTPGMDHAEPSTDWGWSLWVINEDVGLGGQCGMRVR
ncbi:hypothetical protein AAFF_G00355320 [Aldrovandia affinis]|uniref:Uncharacterized protein n=1 Tax=Aldrovandia affinis TaxID=143900 RepID=A0AAD7SJ47_9TELE|nr:hypothetical protein AAFF_G00355320 [Aldrovandia affinis]